MNINILTLVLIAFALSIQVWLVSIFAMQNFPLKDTFSQNVLPEWWYFVRPERDALHFHIFILAALVLCAVILWRFRPRLADAAFMQKARLFLLLEAVWSFLLLSAAFKMVVYDQRPGLAARLFWIIAVLSVLGKVFFSEINVLRHHFNRYLQEPSKRWKHAVEIIFPVLLALLLYIPDVKGVMARDFLGEQFHHWDTAVMTPGWAYLSGCVLNVDVISQYGLGLPIFVANLTKIFGAFTYENVLRVMMGVNIIYYLAWYLLLRRWLKNIPVVIAGMLFAVKIQMFHSGVYPIVFTYPSETILRYVFDVALFALMLGHLRSGRHVYLWGAAVVCGIAVFYMTTTGLCLGLTWCVYCASMVVFPQLRKRFLSDRRSWLALSACFFIIPAAIFVCLWLAEGRHIFTGEFWRKTEEFNNYFLSYFGTVPIQQNITDHNYLPFFMGIAVPLVYLGTFLTVLSLYFWRKFSTEHLLAAFIAFYGLTLYHYFVSRSLTTGVYIEGLPYAFISCFWLSVWLEKAGRSWGHKMALLSIAISAYALLTSYNYIAYPNIFNLSRHPLTDPAVFSPLPDGRSYFNHLYSQLPMESRLPVNSLGETDERLRSEKDFASDEDLRKYYDQEFNFSQDAALIDDLVPPQGKVALVSSFETKILMDARRQPFFYYVPIVISRPMHMRTMVVTALYTQDHFKRTLSQIETQLPEYIFIERIFRKENIDLVNYQDGSAFLSLIHYIHAHYENFREGHFLMALKRKGPS